MSRATLTIFSYLENVDILCINWVTLKLFKTFKNIFKLCKVKINGGKV